MTHLTTIKAFSKSFLLCISIAFMSQFAYNFFNRNKKNNVKKEIHEVIMFSFGTNTRKKSRYSRCRITESMDRLLYYLSCPKYTIDICMYVFTNMDLANVITKLVYKGVKVRLIIDADMAYSSGSNVRKLEKQGIPVRWMKSTNLMHHKFCLLDVSAESDLATPMVIMGSLNWTNQALNGNWEDVVVTTQPNLIRQYKEEFEKLWVMFKPIVD